MNQDIILNIIASIGVLIFGGFCYYIRFNTNLRKAAEKAIVAAEKVYKDSAKAGGQKFEYAVNFVYDALPKTLQLIITKDMIAAIIQNTFNYMEDYAKTQLDKLVDKAMNGH